MALTEPLDLVIEGARIVDGTGSPWYRGDIGVVGDRIAVIGALDGVRSRLRLDAAGLVATPGFIDGHVHSEGLLLREPAHLASLHQGVTTHIVAQDGIGLAPTTPASFAFMRDLYGPLVGEAAGHEPGSVATFLARFDGRSACNAAALIPNGLLRLDAIGNVERPASPSELDAMKAACRRGMLDGAVGLSSGLDYVPSGHADTAELVELCSVVASLGGVYVTHVRYALGLLPALEEAVEIGLRSGVAVHISHLRPPGADGDAASLLAFIESARDQRGVDISFDQYPYTYGCTVVSALLPFWMQEGDLAAIRRRLAEPGARRRFRSEWPEGETGPRGLAATDLRLAGRLDGADDELVGLDLHAAASRRGQHVADLVCDLLLRHGLRPILMGKPGGERTKRELDAMLRHRSHMNMSDGVFADGMAHPRGASSFARLVGRMVRGGRAGPLEETVRHATAYTAARHGLHDRGVLKVGLAADIAVFDPGTLIDHATDGDGNRLATGVAHVIVNGVVALRDGSVTGETPGRGLRGPAARSDTGIDPPREGRLPQ